MATSMESITLVQQRTFVSFDYTLATIWTKNQPASSTNLSDICLHNTNNVERINLVYQQTLPTFAYTLPKVWKHKSGSSTKLSDIYSHIVNSIEALPWFTNQTFLTFCSDIATSMESITLVHQQTFVSFDYTLPRVWKKSACFINKPFRHLLTQYQQCEKNLPGSSTNHSEICSHIAKSMENINLGNQQIFDICSYIANSNVRINLVHQQTCLTFAYTSSIVWKASTWFTNKPF